MIGNFNGKSTSGKKIIIFSIGSLGDTLTVLPAVRILRKHFQNDQITLLCDFQKDSNYVLAADVLSSAGLIDDVVTYTVHNGPLAYIANMARKAFLLLKLRSQGFHTLIYLVEAYQGDRRILRDQSFFKLSGIKCIIGMEGLEERPLSHGLSIRRVTHRTDEVLNRLVASGIPVPPLDQRDMSSGLESLAAHSFEQWRRDLCSDGGRSWIGVGPGSKMPAKVWPGNRYQNVVQRLIDEYDVWPVIFGGSEDNEIGNTLVKAWGRGYVAAGKLSIQESAVGLHRCRLYVGNDTGTMHLAASVGTPCVAIFSSREPPGRWEPYGPGHRVLRTAIDCAGCCLVDCVARGKECLLRITEEDVIKSCRATLIQKNVDMTHAH
jgi:ADP-heptose:LPS heptosyltransferase